MSFVDDLIKKVFANSKPTQTNTTKGTSVKSEKLIRNYQFLDDFKQWKKDPNTSVLLNSIKQEVKNKQLNLQTNYELGFMDLPSAKGIIIYPISQNSNYNSSFLADLIKENTQALGYVNYQSKSEIEELSKGCQKTESHYLKVSYKSLIKTDNKKQNQLYGNLMIENVWLNEQPKYLKILATYYHGRAYATPLLFSDYLNNVIAL